MVSYLKKYWFFVGIAVVVIIAFTLPAVGVFVKTYNILTMVIFLGFLSTGLTLETASIGEQFKNVRVLSAALISSLLLFPAIAYFLARMVFDAPPDWAIGALIIGVAPVTIAAGTVMVVIATGNVPLSLFICVLSNLASIFTIPFLLSLFLRFGDAPITLPVLSMLTGLAIKVFVPTAIGQMLRPLLKNAIAPYKKLISIFNQCIVLMIMLNGLSSSTTYITQAGSAIVAVFAFMIGLHVLILAMNFAISRLIRLDPPSTATFTIHTSQKTLTISYIVWAGHFAALYPMALIPAIAYHLTQIIMDTLVAQRFREYINRRSTPDLNADAPARTS